MPREPRLSERVTEPAGLGSPFAGDRRGLVVAHRGSSATHPENTIVAFEAAIAAGADAVELDARLTADGRAVVLHDPDVGRTTDGSGPLRAMTLAAVKRLRVRHEGGEAIEVPTLDEALACLAGRAGIDVEIKNVPGEPDFDADRQPVVEATLRALEASGCSGAALVSSFNPLSIARARELAPAVPTGLLAPPEVDAAAALAFARQQGHPWVLPFVGAVLGAGDAFVREAHDAGVRVGTWVVDDPATAVALLRAGVDAVATNDPATIVAARAEAFG